jgi:phage FluMu gp28-like protein
MKDTAQIKICEKSRRTGLTWAEAADAVMTASLQQGSGGRNHFYIGSGKDMAKEFIDACAMWCQVFEKAANAVDQAVLQDGDQSILVYTIRFKSGLKIEALSSNPSNLRGRQGNVTIDEAAFHRELAEIMKAALPLTMWGAKVRLISTHNGVNSLFNELIQDARSGRKTYSIHRVTLDDALAQGLYRRICQTSKKRWTQNQQDAWKQELLGSSATQEDGLEEYYCVPKQSSGAYLARRVIEQAMRDRPVLRFSSDEKFKNLTPEQRRESIQNWLVDNLDPLLQTLNPQALHALGQDFGRSIDLTVLAPIVIGQQLERQVPFIIELQDTPFAIQHQILFYLLDRLPRLQAAALDARGNGQNLAESASERYGDLVKCVMITQAWYLEVMPRLRADLSEGVLTIPKDVDILQDLQAIQYVDGVPKIPAVRTGQKKNRHGDAAIALAMAVYAADQDVEIIEYHSVKVPQQASPGDYDLDNLDQPDRPIKSSGGFNTTRHVW